MMRDYCSAVHLPIRNSAYAKKLILDHVVSIAPQFMDRRGEFNFDKFVDMWMADGPGGRGTAGHLKSREIYAACYTLKRISSRNRRWRSLVSHNFSLLSDAELQFLLELPEEGRATTLAEQTQADLRKMIRGLVERKIVSGLSRDARTDRLVEIWPTEDGLQMRSTAATVLGFRRIETALSQGGFKWRESGDYDLAKTAILSYRGHDAKTFINHARRVVALFGDA